MPGHKFGLERIRDKLNQLLGDSEDQDGLDPQAQATLNADKDIVRLVDDEPRITVYNINDAIQVVDDVVQDVVAGAIRDGVTLTTKDVADVKAYIINNMFSASRPPGVLDSDMRNAGQLDAITDRANQSISQGELQIERFPEAATRGQRFNKVLVEATERGTVSPDLSRRMAATKASKTAELEIGGARGPDTGETASIAEAEALMNALPTLMASVMTEKGADLTSALRGLENDAFPIIPDVQTELNQRASQAQLESMFGAGAADENALRTLNIKPGVEEVFRDLNGPLITGDKELDDAVAREISIEVERIKTLRATALSLGLAVQDIPAALLSSAQENIGDEAFLRGAAEGISEARLESLLPSVPTDLASARSLVESEIDQFFGFSSEQIEPEVIDEIARSILNDVQGAILAGTSDIDIIEGVRNRIRSNQILVQESAVNVAEIEQREEATKALRGADQQGLARGATAAAGVPLPSSVPSARPLALPDVLGAQADQRVVRAVQPVITQEINQAEAQQRLPDIVEAVRRALRDPESIGLLPTDLPGQVRNQRFGGAPLVPPPPVTLLNDGPERFIGLGRTQPPGVPTPFARVPTTGQRADRGLGRAIESVTSGAPEGFGEFLQTQIPGLRNQAVRATREANRPRDDDRPRTFAARINTSQILRQQAPSLLSQFRSQQLEEQRPRLLRQGGRARRRSPVLSILGA